VQKRGPSKFLHKSFPFMLGFDLSNPNWKEKDYALSSKKQNVLFIYKGAKK